MQAAGDCSVSLVGRVFDCGVPVGLCMPIETPLDLVNLGTKEDRIRIIHQLRDLITELHRKDIVHGDLKPQNLLICSDGRLRLCDFDNASIEGDGFVSCQSTLPYCSTVRARSQSEPMTRAEDLYAMGTSMWHIYTGRVPLTYVTDLEEHISGLILDRTLAGFQPDMEAIDDPDIASLIERCIVAGPHRRDELESGQAIYCIQTRLVFGCCKAEPKHTYSRLVHSGCCIDKGDPGPCEDLFVDPIVFTAELEPICTKCNVGVEYTGLF
ncbi:kinase-like domain-containing protein [Mycena filopes]|nr:kinase-like domain-containing protein [Mycena filopes]